MVREVRTSIPREFWPDNGAERFERWIKLPNTPGEHEFQKELPKPWPKKRKKKK